ncbi:MAG: 23S rRNA (adenine(2503)-C(2))-methyltransferase RlmN [Planctomycetota bacterium]
MDVLALTFDQVASTVRPPKGNLRALRDLRAAYRRLVRGESEEERLESGFVLQAAVHPVARHNREGELVKFVQQTTDGYEIESVIVPMRRRGKSWRSLCVSSQIGCARGCVFCETARLGLRRQLSASEIVGQVVAARRIFDADIRNVVFMGMGEPFDNLDEVIRAIEILCDRSGLSFGKSQLRISTAGRADGLRRLAALGWRRLNIAVSLNAPNDEIRSRIMPINRVEPMAALRQAMLEYPLRNCQFFMIEYVLIPGVNDAPEHARELAAYLKPIPSCVNVIPCNPRRDSPFEAPDDETVQRFLGTLRDAGQYCKARVTKGRSHMAGCGQLGNRALAR